jgi:hypothetical protein
MTTLDIGNLALVRGFDLFFHNASEQVLQDIAYELGGKSSYDLCEQRATYMLRNDVLVEVEKLGECHNLANSLGDYFSKKYSCGFEASELYIRTKKPTLNIN